jgi:hypothetical protein
MDLVWSVVPGRRTLSHAEILAEKQQAVELARRIVRRFDELSGRIEPKLRGLIRESLSRLEVLAQACLQMCRLIAAHTEQMWRLPERTVESFDAEAQRLADLAEQVVERFGHPFFPAKLRGDRDGCMTKALRDWAPGLKAERELEIPLRKAMEADKAVVDYVLCGFAAEGHRLAKRLHTGGTFAMAGRFVRQTGAGPDEGFTYHLRSLPGTPLRVTIILADDGAGRSGAVRIGHQEHAFDPGPFTGLRELAFDVAPGKETELPVRVWSTTPEPVRVAAIKLTRRS